MKLSRKMFRAWLKSDAAPKEFDNHGDETWYDQCPIASFAGEHTNRHSCGSDRLPRWAVQFVDTVDEESVNPITSSRALEILDGIK